MDLRLSANSHDRTIIHIDEITHQVDTQQRYDVVPTPAAPPAPHSDDLAGQFHDNGVKVIVGEPHATLMPDEAARYVDVVVVGEAETVATGVYEVFKLE